MQDIPSIHFFTGQHEDYHKPSDDVEKINFEGMYEVFKYVENIIISSTEIENFGFVRTKSDSTTSPRFSVTLGVMPDYMFDGKGMRIDGVSKEKTAEKYGILKGDIVVKIGDLEVIDMMGYMKGLTCKKYSTTVSKRENKTLEILLFFNRMLNSYFFSFRF